MYHAAAFSPMGLRDERYAQRTSELFSALGHPRRVVILECLVEREHTVGELVACERLQPAKQSNTSQHLAVLKQAGLVEDRREGNHVVYRLAVSDAEALLELARRIVEQRVEAML